MDWNWLLSSVSSFLRQKEEDELFDDPIDWVKGRKTLRKKKVRVSEAELRMTQLSENQRSRLEHKAEEKPDNEYLKEFLRKK